MPTDNSWIDCLCIMCLHKMLGMVWHGGWREQCNNIMYTWNGLNITPAGDLSIQCVAVVIPYTNNSCLIPLRLVWFWHETTKDSTFCVSVVPKLFPHALSTAIHGIAWDSILNTLNSLTKAFGPFTEWHQSVYFQLVAALVMPKNGIQFGSCVLWT